MIRSPLILLVLVAVSGCVASSDQREHNVILITLDGVRTQEIFGDLDTSILRATTSKDKAIERIFDS